MKKILLSITFCVMFVSIVWAQNNNESWVYKNYNKSEYKIAMRDGTKLFTVVYSPKDSTTSHPILMSRTPYSVGPYGKDIMKDELWNNLFPYLRKGYILVFQDVRGKFMSEGNYVNVRPFIPDKKGVEIDEASDAYDTAEWLIRNIAYNNGRIGVSGISYPGFYALMAGASNHPAIKAISPQAPVFNWFIGDDFHHNGAFFLMDSFNFIDIFDQIRKKPTKYWNPPTVAYEQSSYDFFKNKSLKELTDTYFGKKRPFWSEMMDHPDYDQWWQERSAAKACGNIRAAVLVVGGLFDAEDCYGAWNAYKEIRKQSPKTNCRIVFGPWSHGSWETTQGDSFGKIDFESKTAQYFRDSIQFPFFEHYLRDSAEIDRLQEATIFFSGENRWKSFASWPPKTKDADFYFSKRKSLEPNKPHIDKECTSYLSDPSNPVPYVENVTQQRNIEYMIADQRFAEGRNDVITFRTPPLENDLTIAGPIHADLRVAISTSDADFVVKLIDVFPETLQTDSKMDGYSMLVRGDIFRGRYRNSYTHPQAFIPNEVSQVKFALSDVAHTFRKGHRIMVQVQSSWFPLVDMNPQQFIDIYKCSSKDFIPATIQLFHDTDHPSKIILPVLK